jgi:hypothetical protein
MIDGTIAHKDHEHAQVQGNLGIQRNGVVAIVRPRGFSQGTPSIRYFYNRTQPRPLSGRGRT